VCVWSISCGRKVLQPNMFAMFIRFASIGYGRFVAMRYKFKLSAYNQELLAIGRVEYGERFKQENS
jgi:hypothetical protein